MNDDPMSLPAADTAMARGHLRALERSAWFGELDASLRREILERGIARRFPARSLVYTAGSDPGGFFVVLAGEVRLEHMARSGKVAFYQALRPGDYFGLLAEIDGSARFSDARAWIDSVLLQLTHADFQHLYHRHPAAPAGFVALLCRQLHTTLGMLIEEHSLPPRRQIASLLLSLLADRERAPVGAARLTHEAIAAMAGVSRPTASKVLRELRESGMIEMGYGRLTLRDADALREVALRDT